LQEGVVDFNVTGSVLIGTDWYGLVVQSY